MNYHTYFEDSLASIKAENRYRVFRALNRNASFPTTHCNQKEIVSWCGVDYLGLTQNAVLKQALCDAVQKYGTGAGGTRNIGGTHVKHVELEAALADLHEQEAALLFTSGYVANQTTLSTLGKIIPNLVFLSDADNHRSIIEGIRESQCQKVIFAHNDVGDLEKKLAALPIDHPKIIVFESVYSMSGDFAPITEIIALARQYNAMTYLDEVHALGVYGKQGGGLSQEWGLAHDLTFIQGTLGKGFGLLGGYIAGSQCMIDSIRLMGNGFIFTVSLPPHICATGLAVLSHLKMHQDAQQKLQETVAYLKQKLKEAALPMMPSDSQIIPILIGDPVRCQAIAERLFAEYGIYTQAVNYPTVRKGEERLRISPTALHTNAHVDQLVQALRAVF